jgi:hypothetical protein
VNYFARWSKHKVFISIPYLFHVLTISLHAGSVLLFLPAYSPDFNPIEESFSASEFVPVSTIFEPNGIIQSKHGSEGIIGA